MTNTTPVSGARAQFFRMCKGAEGASELLAAWESLLDKPAYHRFVANWLLLLDGHNPMPQVERCEGIIRQAGHELAAAEVLKPSNVLSLVFSSRVIHREVYQGFHMFLAAQLINGNSSLSERDLLTLYSSMDRLLRGGQAWRKIERAPAATGQFYHSLAAVSFPTLHQITTPLNNLLENRGRELFGPRYERVKTGALSPQYMIAAGTALKNGRQQVTISDAVEAAWSYVAVFDTDLRSLPLIVRDGSSGYEAPA